MNRPGLAIKLYRCVKPFHNRGEISLALEIGEATLCWAAHRGNGLTGCCCFLALRRSNRNCLFSSALSRRFCSLILPGRFVMGGVTLSGWLGVDS